MPLHAHPAQYKRSPRKLLLSFFGEFLWQEQREQVRARAVIHALEGAGLNAPAVRAALERKVLKGMLSRTKRGREVEYSLTPRTEKVLRDAQERVLGERPFDPVGEGWSLVLFSLPDETQPTRHRLRSLLAWEGFAPFGRGAWIAPGEVDFDALRAATTSSVQTDTVVAFRAHEADGFSMSGAVDATWNISAIADAHHRFADIWAPGLEAGLAETESPMALRTMLIADWLDLLKQDPRLPAQHLPSEWPADASHKLFLRWYRELAAPSIEELRSLLGE